jgi:hypothetical protein
MTSNHSCTYRRHEARALLLVSWLQLRLPCAAGACGRLRFEDRSTKGNEDVDAALAVNLAVGCTAPELGGIFGNDYDAGQPPGFSISTSIGMIAGFADGAIQLLPISNEGINYAEVSSQTVADFTNRRLATEVAMMVNTAKDIDVPFQIGDRRTSNNGTYLEIAQAEGMLTAKSWVNKVETLLFSRSFDSVRDRWWQFRESAGTVFMETAIDGVSWVVLASTPTPIWWSKASFTFATGTFRQISPPLGKALFDNTLDCKMP